MADSVCAARVHKLLTKRYIVSVHSIRSPWNWPFLLRLFNFGGRRLDEAGSVVAREKTSQIGL